jgi:LysM domain
MTMKKILILGLLLLIPAIVSAENAGRVYTIKKGDTLWGISERFIKDPDYWPNLWSNNPFIGNPHLIYPGQKLMIYDGRVEIVGKQRPLEATPIDAAKPTAAELQSSEPLPVPQEEIVIKTLGGSEGFVSNEELEKAGKIVDTTDNRIMMAAGDTVFCEMDNLALVRPGDAFNLIGVGNEIQHPLSGEVLGRQVANLGSLIILSVNEEVATAKITTSFREIRRGALLVPFEPPALEVVLKQSQNLLTGVIIATKEGKIGLGQNDLVYLDLGEQEGLEAGNLLYLTRSRKPSELIADQTELKLPEVLLGSAVVLKTRQHTASALVLKAAQAIYLGDNVQTVTE